MKSIVLALGIIFVSFQAAANSAPAPVEFNAKAGDTVTTSNNVFTAEELGAVDRYFPFALPDKLHPKVEEIKIITWATTFLCPLLGAFVSDASLDSAPENKDLWTTAIIHFIASWAAAVTVVGLLFTCVDALYLAPVAVLTTWHRAYGGKMSKKSKAHAATAPPSMAMAY